ncbi:MAG: hypothetical protein JXQ93_00235 [Flavobacteriaceae bacterium]
MKLGVYLIMIIGLTTCKTLKLEKNPPFKVIGATYNNWVGGQQGVSGIRIIIGYTATKKINFKKIFFFDKEANIEMKEKEGKTYLFGYIDTSTRRNNDLVLNSSRKKEIKNTLPERKVAFKLEKNDAIISYLVKGKIKYVKIPNIKQTKTDYYP